MFGSHFYHSSIRKYVSIFGTIFNDITISRTSEDGLVQQKFKVPINYGPMHKYISRVVQDQDLSAPAIILPRMSYMITNINYDGERRLTPHVKTIGSIAASDRAAINYSPVPYNLDIELSIMAKHAEDGAKILEQILPFFTPDFTVTAQMIDGLETLTDIPIVLNAVTNEDSFEGSFEENRIITWTLNFNLKGYFYGPMSEKKLIKFVEVKTHSDVTNDVDPVSAITVQPGLTEDGKPTNDSTDSIDWQDINMDDDWGYIVKIEDYNE